MPAVARPLVTSLVRPMVGRRGGLPTSIAPSGPIASSANGQVISGLDIFADGASGITVSHTGVTIRNCRVRHKGGHGIVGTNCADIRIENCDIRHVATPAAGALAAEENNIFLTTANNARVVGSKVVGGSTGVYIVNSTAPVVTRLQGDDMRGPFPRGQMLQFNNCPGAILDGFSGVNGLANSFPEDNVSIYQSANVQVLNGLVDGNNAPNGVGVMFEGSASGICTDVDAVHMGNGAFSAASAGSTNVAFTNCRTRDGHNTPTGGRPTPASNGVSFAAINGATANLFGCKWFATANDANLISEFGGGTFGTKDIASQNFVARSPLALSWPWQDYSGGPFVLVLNGPDGSGNCAPLDTTATGATIGKLYAESGSPSETFAYAITSDPSGLFSLTGDLVKTTGAITAGSYPVTFRVTGSRSGTKSLTKTIVVSTLTNLFASISDVSNAYWSKTNVTIIESQADDAAGSTAEGVRETAISAEHFWGRTITKAAGAKAYQVRVKFKGVNRTRLIVFAYNAAFSTAQIGYFMQTGPANFQAGAFGGASNPTGSITAIGNGYFECVMNFTSSADTSMPVFFYLSDADYNQSYLGVVANGGNVLNHRLYAV